MSKGIRKSKRKELALVAGVCILAVASHGSVFGRDDVEKAVEEAVAAGRGTPVPDFEALGKDAGLNDYVKANTGSTAQIEALRRDGQGELYWPGRSQADACWKHNDPRCLAVQMVDKGSANRPNLDPDLAGDLIAGRDEVIGSAEDRVDLGGTGSSTGTCRKHTTTITGPEETVTCEVRTTERPGGAVEKSCTRRFEEITDERSVWACSNTLKEVSQEACSIPVVVKQETTTTLACFEGRKDAKTETCPVTVSVAQKQKHYAACLKPEYRSVTRTCTKRLVVRAQASCRIGEIEKASNTDYGGLGEDAVPGADTLEVRSVCAEKGFRLILATNSRPGGEADLAVETTSDVFETVMNVAGGMVRFAGDVSCNAADCIASVTMSVYKASGTSHVYQGEVSLRLPFTRFVRQSETEHWSETCTGV